MHISQHHTISYLPPGALCAVSEAFCEEIKSENFQSHEAPDPKNLKGSPNGKDFHISRRQAKCVRSLYLACSMHLWNCHLQIARLRKKLTR